MISNISDFIHPRDERVIVTSSREIFIAAAGNHDEFRAAILQRDPNPRLTGYFQTVAQTMKPPYINLRAHINKDAVSIETPDENEFEFYDLAKDEVSYMNRLYYDLTGIERMNTTLSRTNISSTMHAHDDFAVLNCNEVSNGTGWENIRGEKLFVRRGDIIFLKPGFRHIGWIDPESQPDPLKMLVAVMPEAMEHH